MSIDTTTVKKIARLARLDIEEARADAMSAELSTIMGFVEQLQAVDVTGVEPLLSVSQATLPRRADVVTDGNYVDAILKNAPEKKQGFFVVPKVVG